MLAKSESTSDEMLYDCHRAVVEHIGGIAVSNNLEALPCKGARDYDRALHCVSFRLEFQSESLHGHYDSLLLQRSSFARSAPFIKRA